MVRLTFLGIMLSVSAALGGCIDQTATTEQHAKVNVSDVPQFNSDGELLLPDNIDEWVLLGSSIGQRYEEVEFDSNSPGMFQVVQMEPTAYAEYKRTGEFPDGTMFALSFYTAETDVPPNQAGFVMGESHGIEIHIRSSERFESGSGFFNFGMGDTGQLIPAPNACIACHTEHAESDMVFTQFYPVLRN